MENENLIGYIDNLTSFGIIAPKRRSLIVTDKRLLIVDSSSMSSTAVSAERHRTCYNEQDKKSYWLLFYKQRL